MSVSLQVSEHRPRNALAAGTAEARLQGAEQPVGAARPWATWFGWLVAACLIVLAFQARQQLQIQQRLLAGGQELAQLVAESGSVAAETNEQLTLVRDLDAATARLDAKLVTIGHTNELVQGELDVLEVAVRDILTAVDQLGGQAAGSRAVLQDIGAESAALHGILLESEQLGAEISAHLATLVLTQEAINADLAAMETKTRFLDRFTRE